MNVPNTERIEDDGDGVRPGWSSTPTDGPGLWKTLGLKRESPARGVAIVEWRASAEYSIPLAATPIIHGGLVATVMDSSMGGATWTTLTPEEAFFTADIRAEFHRTAYPGLLIATGRVIRKSRRIVFCESQLTNADEQPLASARCTQVIVPKSRRGPA